jgi:hypothetical protein
MTCVRHPWPQFAHLLHSQTEANNMQMHRVLKKSSASAIK